jgi:putative transposase
LKHSKFPVLHIILTPNNAKTWLKVEVVCRTTGTWNHLFQLEEKYEDIGVPEQRKFRQLEDENFRLIQIIFDLTLEKQMLQYDSKRLWNQSIWESWLMACSMILICPLGKLIWLFLSTDPYFQLCQQGWFWYSIRDERKSYGKCELWIQSNVYIV